MMKLRIPLITLALLCVGNGFAGDGSQDAVPKIYSGTYSYSWETAIFSPAESSERWWVADGDMSKAELPPKKGQFLAFGSAKVTVRGIIGPKGQYGHLGCCTRELHVKKVLEVHDRKEF